jgi:hypothetical protein
MPKMLKQLLFIGALVAVPCAHGLAAPAASKLLPLVPHAAQIVAGIEDPAGSHGHLLLVTISNTYDYDDWLGLTGVDTHRMIDEVVWTAASAPQAELNEHELLVAGRFDRDHIFAAAVQNGARPAEYNGVKVLLVQPFVRERHEMVDTRWMAILDDRTAIFGTPQMVRHTLDQYAAHDAPDPQLVSRVARVHPDVNCWNILAMPSPVLARHLALGPLSEWAQALDETGELTIGIHYGPTVRVDFAIQTARNALVSSIEEWQARPTLLQVGAKQSLRPRIEKLTIGPGRIEGSMSAERRKFDSWMESITNKVTLASNSQ